MSLANSSLIMQQTEGEPALGIITQPIIAQTYHQLTFTDSQQPLNPATTIQYEIPITTVAIEGCTTDVRVGEHNDEQGSQQQEQSNLTNLDTTVVLAMKSSSSDPRKFVCHLCCRTVKSKQALDMHIRSHTGEKPYSCSECGKNFSQQASLNRHRKGVHLPKTQECYECGRKFGYRDYLVKHIRIHTGERPYVCPKCDKRFRDKTSLNQHSKWHK